MGLNALACDGTDPGGDWPTEHGLLVPGIGTEAGEVMYRAIYNPGRSFGLTVTKNF